MPGVERVDLVLAGIGQIATANGRAAAGGEAQGRLATATGQAIAVREGRIVALGDEAAISRAYAGATRLDAGGRLVTPGLVDPHTHAAFTGSRADEYDARLRGDDYEKIAKRGGGIRATVRSVRAAADSVLRDETRVRLRRMLAAGATTVEVKSGYGLTLHDEIRLLTCVRDAAGDGVPDTAATFLGAHEIPDEARHDPDAYVRLVCEGMIPEVARRRLAEACDVFCERGVFDVPQSRRILQSAREIGLAVKLHAEEFAPTGGARLAAEMRALSADHLLAVDRDGIAALAGGGVVAVLLPGTSLVLRRPPAPARDLVRAGVPIAVGTDCNPGSCFLESMGMVLALACDHLGLSAAEALVAATLNAAAALGRAGDRGTLEPGKRADWVVWDAQEYRELPYRFGAGLAETVVLGGRVAWTRSGS